MSDVLRAALDCIACPQCRSQCGPYRCRFTGITHEEFFWNEGTKQVKRDKERPAWLRNVLTGGKEPQ